MPDIGRRYLVEAFASAQPNAAKLGSLLDASVPQFSVGLGGTEPLTLSLPRVYGWCEAPAEIGSSGAVANQVRVDVWATDQWSLALPDTYQRSRLIYRGTVERRRYHLDTGGVDLVIYPYGRIADQTPLEGTWPSTNDLLNTVLTLWQRSGVLGVIGWDPRNDQWGGVSINTVFYPTGAMLMSYTQTLIQSVGPQWHTYVTPQGNVRVFDETNLNLVRQHALRHGGNCRVSTLDFSTEALAKYVITYYGTSALSGTAINASKAVAQAVDYTASDPRALLAPLPDRMPGVYAGQYAKAVLADHNRVEALAEVDVSVADYDIDSISPGDQVTLAVPRVRATGANDPEDITTYTLRVARLSYAGDRVSLELGRPVRDIMLDMVSGNRQALDALHGLMANA